MNEIFIVLGDPGTPISLLPDLFLPFYSDHRKSPGNMCPIYRGVDRGQMGSSRTGEGENSWRGSWDRRCLSE